MDLEGNYIHTMTRISKIAVGCILLVAGTSAFVPNIPTQPQSHICISDSSSTALCATDNNSNGNDENNNGFGANFIESIRKTAAVSALALGLTFTTLSSSPLPAMATDSAAIVGCLFSKCQLPLAKCIANPKCLANVVCINTCNGREDEIGCQIKCGDLFENEVVGEFNKCVVSDMGCVPQKPDEGLYPEPAPEALVQKFDTKLWNGKWYITSGQNELFDVRFSTVTQTWASRFVSSCCFRLEKFLIILLVLMFRNYAVPILSFFSNYLFLYYLLQIFPCQVHFFSETAPGKFVGKLNWRIEEPDGEFFTRDALQEFVQYPKLFCI